MFFPAVRAFRVWVFVSLLPVFSFLIGQLAEAGTSPPSGQSNQNVYFDLEQKANGVLNPTKPVDLSVYMNGTPPGKGSLVAIFEGKSFVRRLVPMMQTQEQEQYRASVTVEPFFSGLSESQGKALRVSVTFARLVGMKLHRFLTHTVYITFGFPAESATLNTSRFSQVPSESPKDLSAVSAMFSEGSAEEGKGLITERDLIDEGIRDSRVEEIYLRQVSHLITRSWAGPDRNSRKKKHKGTVQVRFRLHANGEAQLIQVERTSGRDDIDEAGLRAIVNAHPFPPFPASIQHESIDMHIELSRTAQAKPPSKRPKGTRKGRAPSRGR